MTQRSALALIVLALAAPLGACGNEAPAETLAPPAADSPPTADPVAVHGADPQATPSLAHGGAAAPAANTGGPAPTAGTVEETMDAGSYTYMLVNTGSASVWVAAMAMPVAVGDHVEFQGSTMANFHSSTLDRTFDQVVFANSARVVGGDGEAAPSHQAQPLAPGQTALPQGHPPIGNGPEPSPSAPVPSAAPSAPAPSAP